MAKSTEKTALYVHTEVKDPELVLKRRRQLVDAVVELFIKNGFHKTTTREMAKAAGFSIGTLYEYVKSKEDVLYLVCQAIHQEMESRLTARLSGIGSGAKALKTAIATYFRVCSEMSSHILLIYQETKSLPQESMRFVLEHDERITGIFAGIIQDGVAGGFFKPLDRAGVDLMAHNIVVLGHMWTFRRWSLSKNYSLEAYTEKQQNLIMGQLI
jgi:AcrR family transcriptional regulator